MSERDNTSYLCNGKDLNTVSAEKTNMLTRWLASGTPSSLPETHRNKCNSHKITYQVTSRCHLGASLGSLEHD